MTAPEVPGIASLHAVTALLPWGVLLLDEAGELLFASASACKLLDMADEPSLRARWGTLRKTLGLADLGEHSLDAAPLCAEVAAGDTKRPLRLECQAVPASDATNYLVLLQSRGSLGATDAMLVSASRARTDRHVIAGALHDLNGRINTLHLTLALLDGAIERLRAEQTNDPAIERCARYVETLNSEAKRLTDVAHGLAATATDEPTVGGVESATALVAQTQRALRHHAALREIHLTVSTSEADLRVDGDPVLLRAAVLDLLAVAIDTSTPGGAVAVDAAADDGEVVMRIAAATSGLLPDPQRTLACVAVTPRGEWIGILAARAILEAHGGSATVRQRMQGGIVLEARLPLHHD